MGHLNEKKVLDILEHAFALPTHARNTYIQQTCDGDPDLEQEVRACLEADSQTDWVPTDAPELVQELPEKIGPYYIESCLGEGGMGSVYLGTRKDETFQHSVAIKVLKHSLHSKAMVRRFLVERQILAQLNHPQIAKFFDGGSTESGAPYLVMEYVDGRPITEYCQMKNLALEQRLHLFLKVCDALAHAHQSLVIHRDIKPSNVLVTAKGELKLLDFGIAKPLGNLPDDFKDHTTTGLGLMTPFYASPEQLRGKMLTPGVDVYGLGLLLFELVTHTRPFDLEQASLETIVQTVCETPAPKPSAVLMAKTHQAQEGKEADLNDRHPLFKKRWRAALKSDLDAVVLKALRKDPGARYRTALELGDDIRRFLTKKPVKARAGSRAYRIKKSLVRYRFRWLGLAAGILGFVGFSTYILIQRNQLQRERTQVLAQADRAREMKDFLITLFAIPQSAASEEKPVSVEELLDQGLEKVENQGYAPEPKAELLQTLSSVYRGMGWYETANEVLEQSLTLKKERYENTDESLLSGLDEKANLQLSEGRFEEARATLEAVMPHLEALSRRSAIVTQIYTTYAETLRALGNYDEAVVYVERALNRQRFYLKPDHSEVAIVRSQLGFLQHFTGDYQASLKNLEKAYAIAQKRKGQRPKLLFDVLKNLAIAYQNQGHTGEAEKAYKRVLEWQQTNLGEKHPDVALTLHNLGTLYRDTGRLEDAKAKFLEVLTIHKLAKTGNTPFASSVMYSLSSIQYALGQYGEAEQTLEQVLALDKKFLGENHPEIALTYGFLGYVLAENENFERADFCYQRALAILEGTVGKNHREFAVTLGNYGRVLGKKGDAERAESLLRESLDIFKALFAPDKIEIATAKDRLGTHLLATQAFEEASELYEDALAIVQKQEHPDPYFKASLQKSLASSLIGQDHFKDAERLLKESHDFCKGLSGTRRNQLQIPVLETKVQLYERWGKPKLAQRFRVQLDQHLALNQH